MTLPRFNPDRPLVKENGLWKPAYGISGTPGDGDVPIYDAGDGFASWGPPPGGSGSPPWVQYAADSPPGSTQTEDDEFNASSLDAKWTQSIVAGSPTIDIDTTARSHYCMTVPSTSQCQVFLRQSFGNTDLSIAARVRMGPLNASPPSCRLFAQDNSGNSLTEAMSVLWQGNEEIHLQSRESGTPNSRGSRIGLGSGITSFILYLRRSGNTWTGWYSLDGWAWLRLGSHSKTFTVAAIGIGFTSAATANSIPGERFMCDWFRRDWITL